MHMCLETSIFSYLQFFIAVLILVNDWKVRSSWTHATQTHQIFKMLILVHNEVCGIYRSCTILMFLIMWLNPLNTVIFLNGKILRKSLNIYDLFITRCIPLHFFRANPPDSPLRPSLSLRPHRHPPHHKEHHHHHCFYRRCIEKKPVVKNGNYEN